MGLPDRPGEEQVADDPGVPCWLWRSDMFASLDEPRLRLLQAEFQLVPLGGHQVLFREGDPGDSLYLVISGRLQAVRDDPEGGERVLGELGPGDVLGEIALITGECRTATVRAVRDSSLARLSKESFDRLVAVNPGIALQAARVTVERALGRTRRDASSRAFNLALVPLDPDLDYDALAGALHQGLAALGRVAVISAATLESQLGPGAAGLRPGEARDSDVAEWLNNLELEHDFVVYRAAPTLTPWTLRCLRQADRFVLVADAGANPRLRPVEKELFDPRGPGRYVQKFLVLAHAEGGRQATRTAAWLGDRPLHGHYHVRRGRAEDFARLARCLTDRAVGLALGGGGYRAVAHVGVFRALRECGVPIDAVSGTSAGACVAGLIAYGDDPTTILQKVSRVCKSTLGNLLTMGPPIVALMSGSHQKRIVPPMFGGALIEDLFLPFTAIATDLHTGQEVQLRRGSLWLAVRASTSLPGIWPPVQLEERTLVDGGVLNNLPINALQDRCARGSVIAVDIGSGKEGFADYHPYGHTISGWSLLLRRLTPFSLKVPSLFDVISRCVTLGDSLRQQKVWGTNLLYLTPPVGEYGMFGIRTERAITSVEERGYRCAREALAGWSWKR